MVFFRNFCFEIFENIFELGWICYAEKSHGEEILPYVSRVRSPQAIAGVLVKDYFAKLLGKTCFQLQFYTKNNKIRPIFRCDAGSDVPPDGDALFR